MKRSFRKGCCYPAHIEKNLLYCYINHLLPTQEKMGTVKRLSSFHRFQMAKHFVVIEYSGMAESEKVDVADLSVKGKSDVTYDFSAKDFASYANFKIAATAGVASITGASIGYYAGTGMFYPFYTYAFNVGVVGYSFYGTTYALRKLRQKEDITNFAVAGALNGAIVGSLLGGNRKRSAIIGVIVGCIGGAVYRVGSEALYASSRELYITNRRFILENSQFRMLSMKKPSIEPIKKYEIPPERRIAAVERMKVSVPKEST